MRKKQLLLPILFVALGGMAWRASVPAPLGPAQGTRIEGETTRRPATASSRSFRIATFNIHGCKGADGERDVDRVARCLESEKLDFVALNEVRGPRLWQDVDQAGRLGQELGLAWLFAPNTRCWHHLDSGNGLLSALPVEFWQRIPLAPRAGRGYRNAALVGLRQGDRTIRVLLTHVTRHDEASREAELREVINLFQSLAEPAILLGDLNSDADDPQMRRLLNSPGVSDPVGQVLGAKTPRRIDWIVARGLRCTDAGIRDDGASDHPLIWAELE